MIDHGAYVRGYFFGTGDEFVYGPPNPLTPDETAFIYRRIFGLPEPPHDPVVAALECAAMDELGGLSRSEHDASRADAIVRDFLTPARETRIAERAAALTDADLRIRELARETAKNNHYNSRRWFWLAENAPHPAERFRECSHPDCVLVRTGVPPLREE